ncbi:MAG: DUF2523 domain-containing protein [Pseudomonadota bacterium]|nr:DUF2523 domain-containing protein [Pseudomonadota bacterium]
MPLVVWILGLIGPVVGRVLVSLGFSVVTVVGMDIAIGLLKNQVVGAASSLPADTLALFLMAGGGYAINMIFSAISFRLAYWALTKATRIIGVSS